MENAARALEIAAGVLLGVMLFALVAYFFSSIGSMPEQEDDILTAEQLAKFNLEYEVYDKSAMYGVDVISCLNKAISNNDKYVKGGSFLTGTAYEDKYKINVKVKINDDLKESLYIYNASSQQVLANGYTNSETMGEAGFEIPTIDGKKYTTFDENTHLEPSTEVKVIDSLDTVNVKTLKVGSDGNSLLKDTDGISYDEPLINLLSFSANDKMKQTVRNYDSSTLSIWGSATWETALYDFKKKRFRCDGIKYNSDTGRVCLIEFSELE